jgi:DNA-binding GntR family transcriptional regulator
MSTPSSATANGSKPEALAERIRAAILEHRLAPGAKLTEAQLCEVFGVKRGPIRQALALLATDHLVDLEPNRGAFVASPSLQEVHEVFEMRRIIELAVVEKICAGHGPRRLKKYRQHDRPRAQSVRNAGFFGLDPALR